MENKSMPSKGRKIICKIVPTLTNDLIEIQQNLERIHKLGEYISEDFQKKIHKIKESVDKNTKEKIANLSTNINKKLNSIEGLDKK